MTLASAQYVEDVMDCYDDACQFEKIRHGRDGRMPVSSAIAACRAAHRKKVRRARHRSSSSWRHVAT